MARYVVKRLLWMIVVVVAVAIIIFSIMYVVPGDPATLVLGTSASPAEKEAWNEANGLDKSYIVQLGTYLYNTFIKFDFGTSYIFKTPVLQEFASRVPRTFLLAFISILLDVAIGIPLGIFSALKRNSVADYTVKVVALAGMSAPNFWVALMLVVLFTKQLGILPAYGFGSVKYWVMPVIANALAGAGQIVRQTRSSVLETVREDFITSAKAKGVNSRNVTLRHMLPNALIPVITLIGNFFAGALAGTVVIETVFSFPGIGTYLMTGINYRDYPVVRGCVLILAIFSALVILLVDLVYAFLDPRIREEYSTPKKKKNKAKGGQTA